MNKESFFKQYALILGKVSAIVFTNPFSEERGQLNQEIVGRGSIDFQEQLQLLIDIVSKLLNELEAVGVQKWQDSPTSYREIMRHVYLFECYHHWINNFDQLINDSMKDVDENPKVEFFQEAIDQLKSRGFHKEEAIHYFSLFFQLRRAFYFIHRNLVGCCPSMQALRVKLWNSVFTHNIFFYEKKLISNMEDFSTLILGPTGVGKGAAARAIGYCGYIPFDVKENKFRNHFMKLLVSTNLTQYSAGLLESELFGHKKGSFTGAISDHNGVFSLCHKDGSIFLDEIGDVSYELQVKLLKVLQERIYQKVGDYREFRFSGRIIAATNQNLEDLLHSGRFRHDFYYRLCSNVIQLPTLRQRIEEDSNELKVTLQAVLKNVANDVSLELVDECYDKISKDLGLHYEWPGNVRELEQCVRSIILNGTCQPAIMASKKDGDWTHKILKGDFSANELLANYCRELYQQKKTYEQVAVITQLDRRTVKKYIDSHF